uniref:Uncharacterized protein n=1 Tax=Cacopsylla melanoneura TaxID=428564 RepID=A0A8D8PLM8_9HEMI
MEESCPESKHQQEKVSPSSSSIVLEVSNLQFYIIYRMVPYYSNNGLKVIYWAKSNKGHSYTHGSISRGFQGSRHFVVFQINPSLPWLKLDNFFSTCSTKKW